MSFEIKTGEFVQILHTGEGHWVTISTVAREHPNVCIYDSLYSSAVPPLQSQIACILCTQHKEITLEFMDVASQSGVCDCGLYAVAFATALVQDKKAECYVFDQLSMREHLRKCLVNRKMEMFPYRRLQGCKAGKIRATQAIPIHCFCRLPEQQEDSMQQCTGCKEYIHGACEALKFVDKEWLCKKCFDKTP